MGYGIEDVEVERDAWHRAAEAELRRRGEVEAERDVLAAELATLRARLEAAGWPVRCVGCGAGDIFYDRADGWCCRSCGRTDADE